MKIQFKQQGGAMPPYLTFTPFIPTSNIPQNTIGGQQQTATTTSKQDTGKVTEKDLVSMIEKIDGLPNDMYQVITGLKQMYTLQNVLPSTFSTKSLVDTYLNSLYKTKVATFNKKQFDETYNIVKANKGLSEVAITDSGELIAQNLNTGELKNINVDQYLANKDQFDKKGYQLLTNSNLLYMRAHSPNYAFNNSIFTIVENGIGLEKVQDLLKNNINQLGESNASVVTSVYQKDGKILAGAELLRQLEGYKSNTSIDGLYEAKKVTSEQREQIRLAINYLYTTLPENAKALLRLKSGGGEAGAKQLIEQLLLSKQNVKLESSVTYKGDYNSDGSKKRSSGESGDSTDDKLKYNSAVQLLAGVGYKSKFIIQDGTSDGIIVSSNEIPATKQNQKLGRSSLLDLSQSDFGGILKFKDATMGGLTINQTALDKVMTDGIVHSMDMIIDQNALEKGIIKPDLKALKRKQQADDYIKQNNIDSKDLNKVNEVYQKFNLPMLYDKNGELNANYYARFAVFDGTAISSAFEDTQDSDITFNDFLKELEGQDELNALDEFKKSNPKMHYDSKSWWDSASPIWNSHDSIYKGTIFIPIKNHTLNAMAGTNMTGSQIMQLEDAENYKIQQQKKIQQWVNGNNLKE